MNKKQSSWRVEKLTPYLILGVTIALVIGLFILLSYVVLWGVLIGGLVWLIVFVKNYFFPKQSRAQQTQGRIIEHEDKKD